MKRNSEQQNGFIRGLLILLLGCSVLVLIVFATFRAPLYFPAPATFRIEKGEPLSVIANNLTEKQLIRSPFVFKVVMMILGSDRKITHGDFYFAKPVSMLDVALRISGRNFGILQHRVVFPEGFTNKDMAARLQTTFPEFDSREFLMLAKDKEGYLFPDTYGFSPNVSPQVVIETMHNNFDVQTEKLQKEFEISLHTKADIITMASIVEKEANGIADASVIAGILWKRIDLGIPLQVDAPFYYLYGKTSNKLTSKDLQSNSPYNTYVYKGLPPGPIGNPGIIAITAALHPTESPYLYYLHDTKGVVHYARTFEEHKKNKEIYLAR